MRGLKESFLAGLLVKRVSVLREEDEDKVYDVVSMRVATAPCIPCLLSDCTDLAAACEPPPPPPPPTTAHRAVRAAPVWSIISRWSGLAREILGWENLVNFFFNFNI